MTGLIRMVCMARTNYEMAASVFRLTRSHGRTVPRMNDCLFAVMAINHNASVLHADRDFVVIPGVGQFRIAT